jgi:hypothetical protein
MDRESQWVLPVVRLLQNADQVRSQAELHLSKAAA